MNHIENYYKNKNEKVQGYAAPENNDYVSIRTTRNLKGLEDQFSYVLKITIRPMEQNGTIHGPRHDIFGC
ncbi:hypothetical protein [Bacillus sp. AFS096315]|uniref:hypothetical protein n=1 Tax=Bacillus sp. AFS096315 TaxID=2033517 RepID=UPI001144B89A|nr:hypothetical protein [Bacillus sp. AFS096315]